MTRTISIIFTVSILIFSLVMYPTFQSTEAQIMESMDDSITKSGTMQSMQDPGIGHESHQLAIILPPSDNVYIGALTYSTSEPIQLVSLHGPLTEGEDMGQPIWTPDGETKFALTLVDPETNMGTWMFSGNALAVHTMNTDEFTVSYSVKYWESEMSDSSTTATMESMQDPGIGHESHQLAILMPPSENVNHGLLTYSASEPIQLVSLHGPLTEGEDMGQPIWTPDGETKFALTLVDPETNMGSWIYSGNALAVHTMNTDPFTVSYSVTTLPAEMFDVAEAKTMQSMQDPGIGHESHQLAILMPPSDDVYSGVISYSASEPIQLVSLHGPLAEGEDMGQPIWTPDGETKFALTLVDPETNMGSWGFAGNALAVHTMNTDPFTVSYSVTAWESEMSDAITSSTMQSMQDPGIGHESHQLAILLPPSENVYTGFLGYSTSEPIQLVALHGPLAEGEDMGQPIWTPDGETKFALTLVDPETNMGTWIFSGNALAVHTMNTDEFTVSYSVNAGPMVPAMMEEETIMDEAGMMEKEIMSPLQQTKSGVSASDVICKEGLELIFKSTDNSPACVRSTSVEKLIQIGWGTQ
jgi:hypothetical protein